MAITSSATPSGRKLEFGEQTTQLLRFDLVLMDAVMPTVDGFKTGHTEAAGYCLISSAKRQQPESGVERGGIGRRHSRSMEGAGGAGRP